MSKNLKLEEARTINLVVPASLVLPELPINQRPIKVVLLVLAGLIFVVFLAVVASAPLGFMTWPLAIAVVSVLGVYAVAATLLRRVRRKA